MVRRYQWAILRILPVVVAMGALASPARTSTPGQAAGSAACVAPQQVTALTSGPQQALLMGTATGALWTSSRRGHCATFVSMLPGRIAVGTLLTPPGHPSWLIAGGSLLITTQLPTSLYRSTDAGKTWLRGTQGLPATPILPVQAAITPRGTLVLAYLCSDDIYATAVPPGKQQCSQGLARSDDGGASWHSVGPHHALGRGVIALPNDSLLAIMAAPPGSAMTSRLHVYRSHDDGRTWALAGLLPGNAYDIATLFAVPWTTGQPGRVCAGFGIALLSPAMYCSTDGGAHWTLVWRHVSKGLGSDIAVIAFAGLSRRHILLFSDLGEVYRSIDDGTTWTRAGTGLPATASRVWALAVASDGVTVYAGLSDGLFRSTDGGVTWVAVFRGAT